MTSYIITTLIPTNNSRLKVLKGSGLLGTKTKIDFRGSVDSFQVKSQLDLLPKHSMYTEAQLNKIVSLLTLNEVNNLLD